MEQYTNINKQQHFGSTNVSEEWYTQNIINFFIQEAKAGNRSLTITAKGTKVARDKYK